MKKTDPDTDSDVPVLSPTISSTALHNNLFPNADSNADYELELTRPVHTLIIDDNKDLAKLFADILEVLGCTVSVAWLGETGVALAQEKVPDIIFCDVNMPGDMNGLDVAREIRANRDFNDTLLIAITGFDDPAVTAEARAAGFDEVFGKPIKFAQVKEVVENYAKKIR